MMKFSTSAFMLLICTAALLSTTEGAKQIQLRCECIKTHSDPIPFKLIQSLRVNEAGPHCKNEEIIATMKKGTTCLNPAKDWVISLREKFNKKNVKSQQ
ncbi:interleukin-8-like [Carassius auratus]|uniref:Interleukin-8-like n=1 Tax=Carassius auratus TaxID=7957 RepID=A0A6P6PMY1_CARAU|nr:interleukin-8-like [Carassius auratus]XP_026122129.1 interleukin-8-like [Carassius auratus]XP_052417974.1 interleukin-8 isoform X8 [Carassius gibelio]XP_052417975.1 interleukin-8 isoform X9 [Carassius gibelio]XP_052417976.1 interleukin-8 isoform X10 [Carassius gibelio]